MSVLLALDPGSSQTGYCLYDRKNGVPYEWGKIPNAEILNLLKQLSVVEIAIEFPYPRGQTPSWQLFETCEWAGRFIHVAEERQFPIHKMDRNDIKKFVAGSTRAKDPQVRAALISMFGGDGCITKGKCEACKGKKGFGRGKARVECKKCSGTGKVIPGLLSTMSADAWAALAVAVAFDKLGPSKSAQEIQVDRKAKKALKKEEDLARMARLESEFAEMMAVDQAGMSVKALAKRDNALHRIQLQIRKIKLRYKLNE